MKEIGDPITNYVGLSLSASIGIGEWLSTHIIYNKYSNRYYFTENPAAHHLSPTASTGGAKVSVKHDDTSASLADGGVSNTVHAVVTTLATL